MPRNKDLIQQKDIFELQDGRYRAAPHLYLVVRNGGKSRAWTLVCCVNNKSKNLGLGSANTLKLSAAKDKAAIWYAELLKGNDPRLIGRPVEPAEDQSPLKKITFAELVLPAIEQRERVQAWDNSKTRQAWESDLNRYAVTSFGKKYVQDITREDVLECLKEIWFEKPELATRLCRMIRHVFAFAKQRGFFVGENPAAWRDNLALDLPSKSKFHKTKHQAAPSLDQLKQMMMTTATDLHYGSLCTRFIALTACRVGEGCCARWNEVDLQNKVWSIPVERRKDRRVQNEPFRVPLSRQAVELLMRLPLREGFLFPGQSQGHISKEYPRHFAKRHCGPAVTAHGFRSVFDDWGAENDEDYVACEKALMHNPGTQVERAYKRTDLLEKRRGIMQRWADTICGEKVLRKK